MSQVAELTERYAREDEENDRYVLEALLGTSKGRKWLHARLAEVGIGRQPFSSNALQMAFNCGELNSGQRLLARILEVAPDKYTLMIQEVNDEQRTRTDALTLAQSIADPDA